MLRPALLAELVAQLDEPARDLALVAHPCSALPSIADAVDTGRMIEVGSVVRTKDGSFEGKVLGRHGASGVGGSYEYRSLPEDPNVQVYSVVSDSGEVRAFTAQAIELVSS